MSTLRSRDVSARVPGRELVLIDDDESVHLLVGRLLQRTAQPLIGFTDAEQALSWLRTHQPAYLLVDYRMPRMTGIELLQALDASRPANRRTLLCSAGPTDQPLQLALPGQSVEEIDKRDLLDRTRFLDVLGIERAGDTALSAAPVREPAMHPPAPGQQRCGLLD